MKNILLNTLTSLRASQRNSANYASSPRGLLFIPLMLVCFALSPQTQAVNPPLTPDPGGKPVSNTADGQNALLTITSGIHNSAFGFDALVSNSTGNFNTAVGSVALLLNNGDPAASEGIENTAVGTGALLSNTTGSFNTANGAFALLNNIDGFENTAIGDGALQNNTGDGNTAIGDAALLLNDVGIRNVAIGRFALFSNTGNSNNNTAIGSFALENSASGNLNTALGFSAGTDVNTASNVICIGANVGGVSTTNGELDDSCYIGNIIGAGVDAGTAAFVFVDQDGKLGTTGPPEHR